LRSIGGNFQQPITCDLKEMLEINSQLVDPNSIFSDLLEETPEDDIFLNSLDFSVYAAKALGNILNEAVGNFSCYQESRFSSLPTLPSFGLLEEIELDEEINSLEEEIARIEEHKRILKISSLPGSPLASPVRSSPNYEIKLDFLSESFEQVLPTPIEEITIQKIENTIHEGIIVVAPNKEKPRKRKNGSSKKTRIESEQDCDSTPNKKKKVKSRKKSKKAQDLAEIFKLEEILKIKNVSQEEDEYVDIL